MATAKQNKSFTLYGKTYNIVNPRNVIVLEPEPKGSPDRLTIAGVKAVNVFNDAGELSGAVQISHGMVSRAPKLPASGQPDKKRRFETTPYPNVPGYKWCSHCDEWVIKDGFGADNRNRDKLKSWCQECLAAHRKYIRWQEKHTAIPMAA